MRLTYLAMLTACAAAALTAAPVPASASPAVHYVALGDSYSSGFGAGDYGDSGACARSIHSYPRLWADRHHPDAFGFTACSGAVIPDVRNSQLAPLDGATSLVSITIGGNDIGFSDVVAKCLLGSDDDCTAAIAHARDQRPAVLRDFDSLLATIKDKAPSAKIVVLGYPHLYHTGGACPEMSAGKRQALAGGADELDTSIADRAKADGAVFGDVRAAFAGHEICSASPWINGVAASDGRMHPNRAGYENGYLPAFDQLA